MKIRKKRLKNKYFGKVKTKTEISSNFHRENIKENRKYYLNLIFLIFWQITADGMRGKKNVGVKCLYFFSWLYKCTFKFKKRKSASANTFAQENWIIYYLFFFLGDVEFVCSEIS